MPCPFRFKRQDSTLEFGLSSPPSPSLWFKAQAAIQLLLKAKLEDVLETAFNKYGALISAKSIIFMKGPEALKFLFTADPELIQRSPIAEEGPSSLASMDGPLHTRHRHFVLQAFHKKWLLRYAEKTKENVLAHITNWNEKIDVGHEMMDLSSKVILNTLLGLTEGDPHFQDFIRDYTLIANRGNKNTSPKSPYQKAMLAQPRLWGLLQELLKKRIKQPSGDVLTAFAEAKTNFPDIADTDTLNYIYMLSEFGQEDLGSILTFGIATIAARPELKNLLLEEMDPFDIHSFETEQISNLPHMQNFIRELERLYPPVSFILRYAVADCSFKGYKIPKGHRLLGSIFHTHRDSILFDNPMLFNPRRFESNDSSSTSAKAVMGFGGGYHMCPAKQFVYMQVALILFFLLKTCDFGSSEIIPQIHYNPKAELKEKIHLKIRKL